MNPHEQESWSYTPGQPVSEGDPSGAVPLGASLSLRLGDSGRRQRKYLVWLAICLVSAVAAAVGYSFAVSVTKPELLTVSGTVELRSDVLRTSDLPDEFKCAGAGGNSDIAPGASVTVEDDAGRTVAKGNLQGSSGELGLCMLSFQVENVPSGLKFYKVRIAGRAPSTYSEAEVSRAINLPISDSGVVPTPSPNKAATAEVITIPPNQYGYVVIKTKSGLTSCMVTSDGVGCETSGKGWPLRPDGTPYPSVSFNDQGNVNFMVGNIGNAERIRLDYRTYRALGWTIEATFDGTRFTNDRTGHGAFVSVQRVYGF